MSNFSNGSEAPVRFSERKDQLYGGSQPWSIEELVQAQQLECAGVPSERIAEELGRPLSEVRERLDPPLAPDRPASAGVGFANLKGR